uniref:Uncharacterized protein n=1 Tax=Anguilla anguilla TaxID=7936 RepID=A0A0E9QQZ1_ANGAN
MCRTAKPKL